jgi:hypothetical protein
VHTLGSPIKSREGRIYLEDKVKFYLKLLELEAPTGDLAIDKNNKEDLLR